jgi:hypothetical protein
MGGQRPISEMQEQGAIPSSEMFAVAPTQFQAARPWDIQSSRPEAIAQGIQQGVGSLASGLITAKMLASNQKPDSTMLAASAGKVGPVADRSSTPEVASINQYIKNPNLANFMDMEYPTAFKYNRY